MSSWLVEWSGTITRDYGYADVEAVSPDEARERFEQLHPYRRVVSVSRQNAYLPMRLRARHQPNK
jgi:hypothetical protein